MFPAHGEFGKSHTGWGRECRQPFFYVVILPLSGEQVEALPMLASKEVKSMKQMPTTAKKSYYFYHETT